MTCFCAHRDFRKDGLNFFLGHSLIDFELSKNSRNTATKGPSDGDTHEYLNKYNTANCKYSRYIQIKTTEGKLAGQTYKINVNIKV